MAEKRESWTKVQMSNSYHDMETYNLRFIALKV